MAVYRQIQTSFWQDDFVLQLTPEEKYFYLYLLTNSKTKQCGIYQLPMQVIIMETGYNQETVEKLINRFINYGKIIHNPKTREIGIINWPKYNPMESPKIRACVERELKDVKDKSIINSIYPALYPMQGVSQEEEEKEKEKAAAEEEEKEETRMRAGTPNVPQTPNVILSVAKNLCPETPSVILSGAKNLRPGPDLNDYPDYNCSSILLQAELLIKGVWNKQKPNPEEVRITADYILKFGLNEVEIALREAVKYDRKRLAYVESVCQKRKERADIKSKNELDKQKRLEQEKKLAEERKSGVGLGLIKTVFGDG